MAKSSNKSPRRKRVEPRFESKRTVRAKPSDRVGSNQKRGGAQRRNKPLLWRFVGGLLRRTPRLAYWGLVAGLWGGLVVSAIVGFYATQLPSAETWQIPERPPNVRILASDQSVMADRGLTGGKALRLEEMSPYIAQAVVSIEDHRFHKHFGFDPIGFTRAMVRNAMQGRLREGGSTITQQLAKNLFLKPERTFGRKVQELILAVWLETRYSKADILELYLNRVYFGSGATGVDAASRRYFGKSARHVELSEAALLAGLLKAPSRYSPARSPKLAQKRANLVLKAMQREGYVKPGTVTPTSANPGENARHFRSGPEHFVADMVMKEAKSILGTIDRDVVIETTISPFLQAAAQSYLTEALAKHGKKKRVSQAALVSLTPNGAIRSLIGGRDYSHSQFNRATEAKRQPGSAFKTFVWLGALENGLTSQTIRNDVRVAYGKWEPQNYDKRYRGAVTLDHAFSKSLNTIAAQLVMETGPKNVSKLAGRMGIGSRLTANASLALGTSEVSLMELTAAYAPLANGGRTAKPFIIKRIIRDNGEVLYRHKSLKQKSVVSARALGDMNAMLANVMANGTGKAARISHPAGGKTGTSQNFRDAWFVGHTAHLVTGVWFGNDDNSPTHKLTGGSLPARVWRDFMEVAHGDKQKLPLPGAAEYLAALPTNIATPKARPDLTDPQRLAELQNLKARVKQSMKKRETRSIIDVILGRGS